MTLSLRDLNLLWCFGMCTFIMMDTFNSLIWFRVVAYRAAWYGRSSLKPEWILEPAGYTRETAMLSIKTETGTFDAVSGRTEESTLSTVLSFIHASCCTQKDEVQFFHKKKYDGWMEGRPIGFIFTCYSASFIVIQSCHALISTNLHSEIKQWEDFQHADQ